MIKAAKDMTHIGGGTAASSKGVTLRPQAVVDAVRQLQVASQVVYCWHTQPEAPGPPVTLPGSAY